MDNTPQYDQAEITMVTPVVAAPAGTSLHRIVRRFGAIGPAFVPRMVSAR
jgi:hypothetical protein